MGNLAVTPAQVQPIANGAVMHGWMAAGVDGDAGEGVYLDSVSGKWKLEDADLDTCQATLGVLEASSAGGQPCVVQIGGDIDLGADAAPVEGVVYVASPTPGKMCPEGDALLTVGMFKKVMGVGGPNNTLKVKPQSTDCQVQ